MMMEAVLRDLMQLVLVVVVLVLMEWFVSYIWKLRHKDDGIETWEMLLIYGIFAVLVIFVVALFWPQISALFFSYLR